MNKNSMKNEKRNCFMAAQNFINEGKVDEANAKMEEIKELDENGMLSHRLRQIWRAMNSDPNPANVFANTGEMMNFAGKGEEPENMYDSVEYRVAFMNYVVSGKAIPEKFNQSAVTKTSDVGAVISPTVINRIVEKMETIGVILPLVTKTAFAAGATIPTSSVKPVATWVAEGGTSDKQKRHWGHIDIKGFKLRCAIAMTLETVTMSLQFF